MSLPRATIVRWRLAILQSLISAYLCGGMFGGKVADVEHRHGVDWVSFNFCRAISRNARLLYPTKLPRMSPIGRQLRARSDRSAPQQKFANYSITLSASNCIE